MTYTTEIDVPDGKGGILYPKGYTFNPLEYLTYSKTIIVINGSRFGTGQVAYRIGV